MDKSSVSWLSDPENSKNYSIGLLAQCTKDSFDIFPQYLLHFLLLKVIFKFTLPVIQMQQGPVEFERAVFERHCTMWKTGVQWIMKEGVECLDEMVQYNKGLDRGDH